jgi:uncharacterized protein with HEPN domain
MRPEDRIRVLHMIDATETALVFVSGRTRADLDSDRMLLFALVRAIEIISEAASNLSEEARGAQVDIPWHSIVSMRNRLIHAYFDVDRDILWKTVIVELPALLSTLQAMLQSE